MEPYMEAAYSSGYELGGLHWNLWVQILAVQFTSCVAWASYLMPWFLTSKMG